MKKIKFDINVKIIVPLLVLMLIVSMTEGILLYYYTNSYGMAVSQFGFFNVLYSCILCCILYKKSFEKEHKDGFLSKLGDYSFGIYLSHYLVLIFVEKNISNLITFLTTTIILYVINKIYYERIKVRFHETSVRKK